MSADPRKQKKQKQREKKIQQSKLDKSLKQARGVTAVEKKKGAKKLYIMALIVVLAVAFVFISMKH